MIVTRLSPSLACAALLAACAAPPPPLVVKPPVPKLDASLADAEAAVKANQADKALSILSGAASNYPADKAPWLAMAQLRFDRADYGVAIVSAQEALQRDPDDKLGHSIIAVSGLRLSGKALADLSQKNNLSGSVRTEAQELAKLLRTSLGEDVLVPPAQASSKPAPRAPAKAKPRTAPKQSTDGDTFGALK